ncbi:MAG TPA: S-adenosylmethionine decarboxylase, partial [Candidatus Atribacteria bacterium]|nr:S-adenosylmethionine decarboxylase [Candidatus Atribacteria bacterium]
MSKIKKEFFETNAWGLLTNVDLYDCNPETIRDAKAIKRYVDELCELIKMKQFGETQVVNFGEDERVAGFSMVQLIETSLISGHFANHTNNAYIDIF